MIFNEERKQEFFKAINLDKEKPMAQRNVYYVFSALGEIEKKNAMDFCQITKYSDDDKDELFNNVFEPKNRKKFEASKEVLEKYVKWCMEQGFEGANDAFLKSDEWTIENLYRNRYFKDIQEFARELDKIFSPIEMHGLDLVYRCAFWFAFIGIPSNLCFDVVNKEVDLENQVINFRDVTYYIPDEALPALKTLRDAKTFTSLTYSEGKFYISPWSKTYPKAQSNMFLTAKVFYPTGTKALQSMRPLMTRIKATRGYSDKFKMDNLNASGRFVIAKQYHDNYSDKDAKYLIDNLFVDYNNVKRNNPTTRHLANQMSEFKKQYEIWDDTFYGERPV